MGILATHFNQLVQQLLPDKKAQSQTFHNVGRAWAQEVRSRLPASLARSVRWEEQGAQKGQLLLPTLAWYRETGTKPHRIRPKSRKALSFFGRSGNQVVAQVKHPGTKAHPFLDAAWQSARVQNLLANVDSRTQKKF